MSKVLIAASIFALVWVVGWCAGGVAFLNASDEEATRAEAIAGPLTKVGPGSIRLEAFVAEKPVVEAFLTRQPTAAGHFSLVCENWYYDSQNKVQRTATQIAERRSGDRIGLVAGRERIELPLRYWKPDTSKSGDTTRSHNEIPEDLELADEEMALAKACQEEDFIQFTMSEWLLMPRDRVFVAGRLEKRDGAFVLVPETGAETVRLYKGTQAEALEALHGTSLGLRVAGYIFWVIAGFPLLAGLIIWRRRLTLKRGAAPASS